MASNLEELCQFYTSDAYYEGGSFEEQKNDFAHL